MFIGAYTFSFVLLHKILAVNLIIDQGNSTTKIALFKGDKLHSVVSLSRFGSREINDCLDEHTIESAIFSTVRRYDASIIETLQQRIPQVHLFNHLSKLPIEIGYATPQTLGLDRIAAAVGAYMLCPGKPALIIDAGTCVTYDLLTANGLFTGGNIAPGIDLRLLSMHEHTGRLPQVKAEGEIPEMGFSTETAMRAGAILGITYEIEGYIAHLKQDNPDLFVFLTGGDSLKLAAKIKSRIFVNSNLVLIGLNRILHENV